MGEEVYLTDEPCEDCDRDCDMWEMQFCCTRCAWIYGDDTPCEMCDFMDI